MSTLAILLPTLASLRSAVPPKSVLARAALAFEDRTPYVTARAARGWEGQALRFPHQFLYVCEARISACENKHDTRAETAAAIR